VSGYLQAEIDRLDFFVIAATLVEEQRPRPAQSPSTFFFCVSLIPAS
jgi:hypothetical protein